MTLLLGDSRKAAIQTIKKYHYLHSVPSGKSHYFLIGSTIVVYNIPANYNVAKFLLGPDAENGSVWELGRLWAPDGHPPNSLTTAISKSLGIFRPLERHVHAIVAYADPNAGHHGGIYHAASWRYCGQCEESRLYRTPDGILVSRRAFHSGNKHLNKADILKLGYTQETAPGKIRWVKGLTKTARRYLREKFI